MNIVFILGAGASADAQVPMMRDFLEKAMLLTPPPGEVADAFALVSRARSQLQRAQSKARLDIRNVESVFAAFEMAELFGRLGELKPPELERLLPAMRQVIVYTIQHYMLVGIKDGRPLAPRPYDRFAAVVKTLRQAGHQVSIITFNYDPGIDLGLSLLGVDVDYCYSERDDPQNSSIELMKLHGSMNWAMCLTCGGNRIIPRRMRQVLEETASKWRSETSVPDSKQTQIRLSRVAVFEPVRCSGCQTLLRDPMIVPPTASKFGLHRQLRTVWQRAASQLSNADNIFVIGYSWPEGDHFFHQLYALGTVGEQILSRFWVFDPDERVRSKFQSRLLGEQALDCFEIDHAPMKLGSIPQRFTFVDAISSIPYALGSLNVVSVPDRHQEWT